MTSIQELSREELKGLTGKKLLYTLGIGHHKAKEFVGEGFVNVEGVGENYSFLKQEGENIESFRDLSENVVFLKNYDEHEKVVFGDSPKSSLVIYHPKHPRFQNAQSILEKNKLWNN